MLNEGQTWARAFGEKIYIGVYFKTEPEKGLNREMQSV